MKSHFFGGVPAIVSSIPATRMLAFKIDWEGNVLSAIGNGPGIGEVQFTESNYMAMDSHGNLFTGDTGNARITEMVASTNN